MAKRVLFICVHNSGRSQMAEAFLNKLGRGEFTAESGGLEPMPIDPVVVTAMRESGYDLSANHSKDVISFFKNGMLFDYVITVCDESIEAKCPVFPGIAKRLHWPFADPAAATGSDSEKLDRIRVIRDEIRSKIQSFINDIREKGVTT